MKSGDILQLSVNFQSVSWGVQPPVNVLIMIHCSSFKLQPFKRFPCKSKYYADIITFDIESTSYNDKTAFMYIWQMCYNGRIYYGRKWGEFKNIVELINDKAQKKVIIWVHNLSFEFRFFESVFEFDHVFALSAHKVVYCGFDNIIFRCTYQMSNMSLDMLCKNYKLPVHKMQGDLDYRLTRHFNSEMTGCEMMYCAIDVYALYLYLKHMLTECKTFAPVHMPITSTGFTRQLLRENAEKDKQYGVLRHIVKECSPVEPTFYHMLQRAFAGGYTHANFYHIGATLDNVRSLDKTSFYPAIMVKEKFPQQFHEIKPERFLKCIKQGMAVIADVEYIGIVSKKSLTTISSHKCGIKDGVVLDNGRIFSADRIVTTITELDYDVIKKFYNYREIRIGKCYAAKKRYLPKTIVKTILELYANKTKLKGIEEEELFYGKLKALLNSVYGMQVTDITQDLIVYTATHEWKIETPETTEALQEYRNNVKSLLLYQTGVYVTAYCRHELLMHDLYILDKSDGMDVVYNDTDSLKILNYRKYVRYFKAYTMHVRQQMKASADYYGFDFDLYEPKDIHGNKHLLGDLTDEGNYNQFKTLGAKRYIYTQYSPKRKKVELHATVAGCPKKSVVKHLLKTNPDNPFKGFVFGMCIQPKDSGKNTHYYTLPQEPQIITDYTGLKATVTAGYGVSILPQQFEMSLAADFRSFITNSAITSGTLNNEHRFKNYKNVTKILTLKERYL